MLENPENSTSERQPFAMDAWLIAGLCVGSVALIWPFIASEWIPYLDLPQHVGAVAILAGSDPEWRLHDYYDIDLLGSPYLLPYLVAAGLAKVIGPVAAVKTLFAVAAAALPWSLSWAASRFGRDPRVGLLAAPLAFGTFAFMGFLNFVLSLPLWLFWLGWWRGAVDRPEFGPRSWAIGALWSVALFYGHVMTFGFAVGCLGVVALLAIGPRTRAQSELRSLGDRLLRALHFAPGLCLFVAWATLSKVSKEGELGRMLGSSTAQTPPKWAAPLDALKALLDYTLSVYHDSTDELLLLAMVVLAGLFALLRRRDSADRSPREWLADRVPLVLLLAAFVLAVGLPESYRGIWPIAARMAPFVVLLVLLVAPGRLVLPRTSILVGVLLTLATATTHARHFERFQPEVGGVAELIEQIKPGRRTMTLVFERDSPTVRWPVFLHFSQYVVAEKGGVSEFSFVNFTKSPVHYAALNAPPRNPVRFEWTPERFRVAQQLDAWDYVLVKGSQRRGDAAFDGMKPWPVVARAKGWLLYQRP